MTKLVNALANTLPYVFTYADETARLAGDFAILPEDVGALAIQLDDGSLWRMIDNSPLTWTQVAPPGVGGDAGLPASPVPGSLLFAAAANTAVTREATSGWSHNSGAVGGTFPDNITDADLGTACQFDDVTGGVKIVYDAGEAIVVRGIRLVQDGPGDPSGRNHIVVSSSTDGTTWTPRYEWNGVDSSDTYGRRLDGDAEITARYWELHGVNETAAAWNVRQFDLVGPNPDAGDPEWLAPGGENQILRIKFDGGGGVRPYWTD